MKRISVSIAMLFLLAVTAAFARQAASEPKGRVGVESPSARRLEGESTVGGSTPTTGAPEANRATKKGDR